MVDFEFCIRKLYKYSWTETAQKRRTSQEQIEYGMLLMLSQQIETDKVYQGKARKSLFKKK